MKFILKFILLVVIFSSVTIASQGDYEKKYASDDDNIPHFKYNSEHREYVNEEDYLKNSIIEREKERDFEWDEYEIHSIRSSVREGTQPSPRECPRYGCKEEQIFYGPRQTSRFGIELVDYSCGGISNVRSSSIALVGTYGGKAGDHKRDLIEAVNVERGISIISY